jgi:hypothetical protein
MSKFISALAEKNNKTVEAHCNATTLLENTTSALLLWFLQSRSTKLTGKGE